MKQALSANTYYPALTGIRAVAALLVFFHHIVEAPVTPLDTRGYSGLQQLGVWIGGQLHIGVPIFFVLSGFLITTRYYDRLELTGPWFRRYLQNRFARIYPVYLVLTVGALLSMSYAPTGTWYEWGERFTRLDKLVVVGLNLTLLRAWFNQIALIGVPSAWTLTVEETFYMLAPFLLLGLKRTRRLLLVYPFVLLGVGALLVVLCSRFLPYYGLMESMLFMLQSTFFGRCVEFLVGMGLALVLHRHRGEARPGMAYTLVGVVGIGLCVALLGWLFHTLPTVPLAFRTVNNLVLPIAVAALFWGLLHEQTAFRRLLETRLFDLLGKASYVFYLLHLGFFNTAFSSYVTEHWAVRLVTYTLVSIALYKWVEHPLHRRLRAKATKKSAPSMQAVAA